MVQSVSTPACHAGGRRFESVRGRQKRTPPNRVVFFFICTRKPPVRRVVPKSFNYAQSCRSGKPPLCKGRWAKSLILLGGVVLIVTIPQSPQCGDRADCQPSATLSSKISAGVFQPRHFLGRLLIRSSTN